MSQDYFAAIQDDEKHRIQGRAAALSEHLSEWARRYPPVRGSRVPMAALTAAIALPRASVPDALTGAQMILWIFGMDDAFDERAIAFEQIPTTVERWCSIADAGVKDNGDELGTALLEIREELVKKQAFAPFRELWVSHLRLLGETMAQEYQYGLQYGTQGPVALPSLDRYLRSGMYSIGLPFWMSMALILFQDTSVLRQADLLDQTIEHAGAAVRLYNDVRTLSKEIREGGVNSILIIQHELCTSHPERSKEDTLSEAKQRVLELANTYAQRCYASVAQLETNSGQVEETLSRLVALHAYYYARTERDYHTTSQAETYDMLRGGDSIQGGP